MCVFCLSAAFPRKKLSFMSLICPLKMDRILVNWSGQVGRQDPGGGRDVSRGSGLVLSVFSSLVCSFVMWRRSALLHESE